MPATDLGTHLYETLADQIDGGGADAFLRGADALALALLSDSLPCWSDSVATALSGALTNNWELENTLSSNWVRLGAAAAVVGAARPSEAGAAFLASVVWLEGGGTELDCGDSLPSLVAWALLSMLHDDLRGAENASRALAARGATRTAAALRAWGGELMDELDAYVALLGALTADDLDSSSSMVLASIVALQRQGRPASDLRQWLLADADVAVSA
jgi:hypothetical protein